MLLNCGVGRLDSPLESKEIKSVNPKGNHPWIFIGRTDVEDEAPLLWPPNAKSWLIGKDPDGGKGWRQEEKGTTEDEMVGWHHWLSGHEFKQALGVGDGQRSLVCYCMGLQRVGHDWLTELSWTEQKELLHKLMKTNNSNNNNKFSVIQWENKDIGAKYL